MYAVSEWAVTLPRLSRRQHFSKMMVPCQTTVVTVELP